VVPQIEADVIVVYVVTHPSFVGCKLGCGVGIHVPYDAGSVAQHGVPNELPTVMDRPVVTWAARVPNDGGMSPQRLLYSILNSAVRETRFPSCSGSSPVSRFELRIMFVWMFTNLPSWDGTLPEKEFWDRSKFAVSPARFPNCDGISFVKEFPEKSNP
jgi:hypothetical protein